ncbi:hypothetical protein RB195_020728 [Necator americanus]|uniref:Hyaluronidase n=1 Tax=Necator americanus TaxID=51031 RepID=A0ABR1CK80_NECAM
MKGLMSTRADSNFRSIVQEEESLAPALQPPLFKLLMDFRRKPHSVTATITAKESVKWLQFRRGKEWKWNGRALTPSDYYSSPGRQFGIFSTKRVSKKNYVEFDKYNIETNKDHQFWGEKVAIFYEFNFGKYPYYKDYNKSIPINGGLPQKSDLAAHLQVVETNITDKIKDKNSAGLGIIDLEEWRPLFSENGYNKKRVYQNESIKLVTDPSLSEEGKRKKAEKMFNNASMHFFVQTIEKARKLRPHVKWGFYGFPYCNYNAGVKEDDYECSQTYKDWNNQMMFIFNKSDALYPSIYLGPNDRKNHSRSDRYIQAILTEARRISHMFSPPLPIYAYIKIEYDPLNNHNDFYSDEDLCTTIKKPADMGIDGIIFWSSSKNITQRCALIKGKMDTSVGPHTSDTITGHKSCRSNLCSGNGRCISKQNTTCISSQVYTVNINDYKCECDYGYTGDNCADTTTTTTTTVDPLQ